jgi:recombination protein RecA
MGRNDAALALAEAINKKHGPGAIMTASEMYVPKRFHSGSLTLDVSLNGGFSANHWSEIYGAENHGKTAVTLKMLAHNQALDPDYFTLWVASEHYDLDQATALGVDTKRVQVLSTQDMAFAYDTVLDYLEQRAADQIVIDSYPAMISPDEDEKDMDEYTRAEGAKMTNKFFRKAGKAGLRDPNDPDDRPWVGFFINQPRDSMKTVWTPQGQKPTETTPGGRGKNFACYTRLEVARAEWIFEGTGKAKTKVGQVIRTQAIKHKGGPPMRVASMDFYFTDSTEFSRGDYDVPKDVLTASVLMGVIEKRGNWYAFEDEKWQGLDNVLASLRDDEGLVSRVEERTREAVDNPHDKRTWDEKDVESAATAQTKIRRRR